jgi:hypothetical protein
MFNIQYKGIKITKCKKYINLKQNKKTLPSTLLQKQKDSPFRSPPKTKRKTNKQTTKTPQIKEEKKTIKKTNKQKKTTKKK